MTGLSVRDPKNGYNYYSTGVSGGFGQLSTGLRFQDRGKRNYYQNKTDNFYYSSPPYMSHTEKKYFEVQEKRKQDKKLQEDLQSLQSHLTLPDLPESTLGRQTITNIQTDDQSNVSQAKTLTLQSDHHNRQMSLCSGSTSYQKFYKDWSPKRVKDADSEQNNIFLHPYNIEQKQGIKYPFILKNNSCVSYPLLKRQYQKMSDISENRFNILFLKNHLLGNRDKWRTKLRPGENYI